MEMGRQLLGGYYGNNGVYYDTGYTCYQRGGCLAGAIIGSIFFFIGLLLLLLLFFRLRRQRNAQPVTGYGGNYPPADPYAAQNYGYGNQYPQSQPYPQAAYPPPYQGQQPVPPAGAPAGPPANMTDADREKWEREQYEKYGEAGVVQGYPAPGQAGGSGVEMQQLPNKQ